MTVTFRAVIARSLSLSVVLVPGVAYGFVATVQGVPTVSTLGGVIALVLAVGTLTWRMGAVERRLGERIARLEGAAASAVVAAATAATTAATTIAELAKRRADA